MKRNGIVHEPERLHWLNTLPSKNRKQWISLKLNFYQEIKISIAYFLSDFCLDLEWCLWSKFRPESIGSFEPKQLSIDSNDTL